MAAIAVGLVWMAQGVGLLTGSSVMVGDGRWALVGLVHVAVGLSLGISVWQARSRSWRQPATRPT